MQVHLNFEQQPLIELDSDNRRRKERCSTSATSPESLDIVSETFLSIVTEIVGSRQA